ncbi:MAG: hypothetical protein Q8L68_07830, partial [Methylococcales bacterium]|nr:hypothetical protein [Methylococcales bacterium]
KCKSFVRQFMEFLIVTMGTVQMANVRDTSNNLRTVVPSSINLYTAGGAGAVNRGVIVGIGTAAPAISDYKLQTPIAHGTAANQLQYATQDYEAPASPDATTSYMGLRRGFTNGSGASITIREVGIYGCDSTGGDFMFARDLITGGLAVPNGATATITYRIVVIVPGFTRQFINLISRQLRCATISAVDITNTTRSEADAINTLRVVGPGGKSAITQISTATYIGEDIGIVIGTGITAVDTGDWKLATKIVHGKAATQLLHYGTYVENFLTVADNTGTFKIERTWENVSGASIVVNEIGLYSGAGSSFLFQIARRLVDPAVTVANGEVLRATFTVSITT